jgi:hypothetical protein
MEEGVSNGVVNMLILTVPSVCLCLGEPKMDDGLVVNIRVHVKSIREDMMSIVLVTPPLRAKTKDDNTENLVQHNAHFTSSVTIVVT